MPSKPPTPPKSVSLKPIVAAIESAIKQLESLPTQPGKDNTTARVTQALMGLRHTTEALCLPGFDVPDNNG
jgi:hypothetical protein